jgi:hypothetical protein
MPSFIKDGHLTSMIFEDHIRIVRFGAVQVWGHMVGGDQTVYEHTTWFKRAARRLLGHVPAIHADGEVEIVLDISHVFKKELVANLYDFLWTLVLWWTSPALISEYMPSPPCYRMQHMFNSLDLTLQPPFDMQTPDAAIISRRLKRINAAIRTCDELHDQVLETNNTLQPEKKTPELLRYLTYLSSSLKTLRDFTATQEAAQPALKKQRVDTRDAHVEMKTLLARMKLLAHV